MEDTQNKAYTFLRDNNIEMEQISTSSSLLSDDETDEFVVNNDVKPDLPPKDRGWGAWSFLLGLWLLEATMWGFALCFGVFQSYYSSLPEFKDSKAIPVIGALALSTSYMGLPLTNAFTIRFPAYQRPMIFVGWAMCLLSMWLASFATTVWQLILTQGFMFGCSWSICYTPFFYLINDWFDKRTGLSWGILFGASGVSGVILPFALESSMHAVGFRVTLRIFVVLCIVLNGPAFLLIKPRSPLPLRSKRQRKNERTFSENHLFLKNPFFYAFATAIGAQGLAFFIPPTFLPSYATALGMSHASGDSLLAFNSLSQVAGQILLGHLSDKSHPHVPTTLSTLISALATLLLWGPGKTFLPLAAFASLWGFFAQSYSVLWYRAIEHLTASSEELFTCYGYMSLLRGIAMLLQGPLSSALLGTNVSREVYGIGMYKGLVLFTGMMLLISSASSASFVFEKRMKKRELR